MLFVDFGLSSAIAVSVTKNIVSVRLKPKAKLDGMLKMTAIHDICSHAQSQ